MLFANDNLFDLINGVKILGIKDILLRTKERGQHENQALQ
jgi:hypothetical protein